MKNLNKKLNDKYIFYFSFLIIFLCSYLLSKFSIWAADDYAFYNNSWGGVSNFSLSNLFNKTNWFYLNWTGRYVSTFINYILIYFNKEIFNILNAFVNTYLIYIICKLIKTKKFYSPFLIYIICWFLIPSYGQVMLWQIGSIIYLWMATLGLTIIYLFNKLDFSFKLKSTKKIYCIFIILLLFVLSVISGNGFETNSIVIISFMILYLIKSIFFDKKHISIFQLDILIGTILGFLSNLLSPGNAVRMENMNNGESIFSKIYDGLGLWFYNGILSTLLFIIIPLFLCLFIFYINKNKLNNKIYTYLYICMVSFIASLFSFVIISFHRNRNIFLNFYWNNLLRYDCIIVFVFLILIVFGIIVFFKDKKIIIKNKLDNFKSIYLYFISAMIGVASYIVTPSAWCRSYMFMVIFIIISLSLLLKEFNIDNNVFSKFLLVIFVFCFWYSYYVSFTDIYKTYNNMNIIDNQIKSQISDGNKVIYVKSLSSSNKHNSASIEKWVIPPIINDENMVTENGIHKDYEWINIEITKYYFNDINAWNNGNRIIGIE